MCELKNILVSKSSLNINKLGNIKMMTSEPDLDC